MNWWEYLILVNVYLLLFFGFYVLLLKKETFFQLNRLYLVSAALLSFIIPLIQSNWVKSLFITQTMHARIYGSPVLIYQYKPIGHTPLSIGELLAIIYLVGVGILIIRFAAQLISLRKIISQPAPAAPYAFFSKVNLDENMSEKDIIAAHEQVHARQLHSADVLIIEAVMIVNWFNPVVYFYRFAVKHIHEFIADSYTLKNGTDKADYALLLLSQTFNAPQHQLVSNFFNRSLLKQRIMMLQKNRSARIKLIKYGLSVPMFVLMLILAAATVNNSKAVTRVNTFAIKLFAMPANKSTLVKITEIKILPPADNDNIADTSGVKKKISATNKRIDSAIKLEIKAEQAREETFAANVKNDTTIKPGGNELFTAVEVEPSFPGFGQYLAKNIRYPAIDFENKVQGTVYLQFVVETDGNIDNIKVLRAPDETLAAEAIRVVNLSPKWNPGIQNGRPVRTQFTVPIRFSLADGEANKSVAITQGMKGTLSNVIITGYAMNPDTAKLLQNSGKNFYNTATLGALVIIDGKQKTFDDLKLLDVNTIKSINILKDKDAEKLYGDAGKSGVIVVTTKK